MTQSTDRELLELQETLYTSKNPTRRWLHNARKGWIEDKLRSIAPRRRALEVGPGSGIYLSILGDVAEQVVAADVEDAYLKQARQIASNQPNLRCIRDDITRTALDAAAFDLILCTEVIEHIQDSPAALRGLKRLLASEGILILSTPQRFSPLELTAKIAFLPGIIQIVRWIYREPIIATGHINLLTEGELRRQLKQAGFRVQESHKSGVYVPLVAEVGGELALRLERRLERALRGTALSWLLWTQYYVLMHE